MVENRVNKNNPLFGLVYASYGEILMGHIEV